MLLLLLLWLQDDFTAARKTMVKEQIEARGIRGRRVLEAMRTVPRHEFMPPAVRSLAYEDSPAPIGHGATISQPYIVAIMSELLNPEPSSRVLEIGTGSGYQAAILAKLAREVYTIEIVPELARDAESALNRLGFHNVQVRRGDGYKGWPEKAPFDRIILTAAPPQLPQALIDQLAAGGTLVAPVGRMYQELIVISKDKQGRTSRRSTIPVRFVPMVPERQ